jgi:hypothetical protein
MEKTRNRNCAIRREEMRARRGGSPFPPSLLTVYLAEDHAYRPLPYLATPFYLRMFAVGGEIGAILPHFNVAGMLPT